MFQITKKNNQRYSPGLCPDILIAPESGILKPFQMQDHLMNYSAPGHEVRDRYSFLIQDIYQWSKNNYHINGDHAGQSYELLQQVPQSRGKKQVLYE